MKRLIAIDPGKSGGLAVFYDGKLAITFKFESDADIIDILKNEVFKASGGDEIVAVMEQVGGFIAGGEKRMMGYMMFNFGSNYGFYRGALASLGVPLVLVTPQRWQKSISGLSGLKGSPRKRALREAARRLYPMSAATLFTADAILIGDWYLREGGKCESR